MNTNKRNSAVHHTLADQKELLNKQKTYLKKSMEDQKIQLIKEKDKAIQLFHKYRRPARNTILLSLVVNTIFLAGTLFFWAQSSLVWVMNLVVLLILSMLVNAWMLRRVEKNR